MTAPHRSDLNYSQTRLLAADQSQSVIAVASQGNPEKISYTAYGYRHADPHSSTQLGFNGELREQHTQWYMLGNGYRTYNPVLMRFHSPDKWSPFGAGGLNSCVYCVADPINQYDPTGRFAIPLIASQLFAVGGGTSSLGGISLAIFSSGRFSAQGVGAMAAGGAGLLLGAAAFATPAAVVAPILASSSVAAGVASVTLGYRAARAATARATQWFQSVARHFDTPPRYSTLSLDTPPPAFSSLNLAPPYSPPRVRNSIAPTHAPQRSTIGRSSSSALDREALMNPVELATGRVFELPKLQYVNETSSAARKIRTSKP